MINLHRLRLFHELSELGTLTAVARINGLTRPAVSRQMALLEQELKTILFERSKAGAIFTPEGRRLLAKTREIFARVEGLENDFLGRRDAIAGNFRISAFSSYAVGTVPGALRRLEDLYPQLRVSFCELSSQEGVKALLSKEIDLAIIDEWSHLPVNEGRLNIEDVGVDRLVVVVPAKHPLANKKAISLMSLSTERWAINRSASVYRSMLLDACLSYGFTPNEMFSCQNVSVVVELICKLNVVSVLPSLSIAPFNANLSIRILELDKPIYRQMRAISLRDLRRPNVCAAVVKAFRDVEPMRAAPHQLSSK